MVLRHLPVVPVVLTGDAAGALAAELAGPLADLELAAPLIATTDELPDAWRRAAGLQLVED